MSDSPPFTDCWCESVELSWKRLEPAPMTLKLYDTLAREKRDFVPLDRNRVRMYVCGPTVYDFAHIGNARPVIVFDVLFRLLRHLDGAEHVTYVRNVTDVDDKINARAAERGVPIRQLTDETYANFKADVAALGCLEPTVEPRATEYVINPAAPIDMIRLIERLIASGNAYAADGHVLFGVATMPDYGRLSKRSLDEMVAGARVEIAPYKRDPMDFVLWKPSPAELPGWDSPWGRGRPGWHIECSAMSAALLGETFDIHGGGIDLVFPHHENEIAQSRCAFHTPVMANYWMHNGFLQVEGEKMAKSAGNFVTIRELLTGWRGLRWPAQVIRLAMLMTHYRQPIDFGERVLEQALVGLSQFKEFGSKLQDAKPSEPFLAAMCDDLNTPLAIAELHRLTKLARDGAYDLAAKMTTPNARFDPLADSPGRQLWASLEVLGIDIENYDSGWAQKQVQAQISGDQTKEIESLIAARKEARNSKNFAESDRIRDELAAMGVVLKDTKDGTTWEIAR